MPEPRIYVCGVLCGVYLSNSVGLGLGSKLNFRVRSWVRINVGVTSPILLVLAVPWRLFASCQRTTCGCVVWYGVVCVVWCGVAWCIGVSMGFVGEGQSRHRTRRRHGHGRLTPYTVSHTQYTPKPLPGAGYRS